MIWSFVDVTEALLRPLQLLQLTRLRVPRLRAGRHGRAHRSGREQLGCGEGRIRLGAWLQLWLTRPVIRLKVARRNNHRLVFLTTRQAESIPRFCKRRELPSIRWKRKSRLRLTPIVLIHRHSLHPEHRSWLFLCF